MNLRPLIFLATIALFAQQGRAQVVWSTTIDETISWSSGRTVDLNGDEVKDLVTGGGAEFLPTDFGYMAFDGATGDTLWHVATRDQVYTSPTFLDVTNDGIADVFMGGRSAELRAINGATGEQIWEFFPTDGTIQPADSGLFNFYGSQIIPDQNNDNIQDLLIANGGDALAQPGDPDRPIGNLMIISSVDGEEIARAPMPDEAETYCTPVISTFGDDTLRVVYGTGGETLPGSLWRCKLTDVLDEDLSGSERLDSSATNGYVAPASLVDLTGDGVFDIVANNYDSRLLAINGVTEELIWEKYMTDAESNVNPSVGYFNADNVPDLHTTVAIGEWITYTSYIRYTIDGIDGSVIDSTIFDWMNFSSSTCMDVNDDGYDELLTLSNLKHYSPTLNQDVFDARLTLEDKVGNTILFDTIFPGTAMVSTPLIDDVDSNGMVDLLFSYANDSVNPFTSNGLVVCRIELPYSVDDSPSWSSYHGTYGNGHFGESQILVSTENDEMVESSENDLKDWLSTIDVQNWTCELLNVEGRIIETGVFSTKVENRIREEMSVGIYFLRFTSENGESKSKTFKIFGGYSY